MVLSNLLLLDDDDEEGVRRSLVELSSLSDDDGMMARRRPFLADVAGCIIVVDSISKAANPQVVAAVDVEAKG